MSGLIQTQVGSPTTAGLANGTIAAARSGAFGDLMVSQLGGRYYQAAKDGRLFTAANQAGVVTVVGLHTTHTGLAISNPVGSTVDVVIHRVGFGFIVAQPTTGSIIALSAGYSTTEVTHSVASTTLRSCYIGSSATPVAKVDTGATLPVAPTIIEAFGSMLTEAITGSAVMPSYNFDLGGYLILPPGGYAASYTTIASGAGSMVMSFMWEEIPR